ncbi:MAG: hypothetical protein HQL55_05720 [Magnetococcales bacterium]|nr:hypothetical protein [Magnetococcales bacterium]
MSNIPKIFLLDTNVPITANREKELASLPADQVKCVENCVAVVKHIKNKGGLVLDSEDEIFEEYRRHLSLRGQPGVGDSFMKWLHDNRWNFPSENIVGITKIGESYTSFPDHPDLTKFDPSDKKFVAVANAHPDKPPILQATDSKWWGWQKALSECGIAVQFLCPDYAEKKYREKMER